MTPQNKAKPNGFTRTELLAVITVIGLLALTQLAGFARQNQSAKASLCLNNLSQLLKAWHMYAEDFGGRIPAATTQAPSKDPAWAGDGWLDFTADRSENYDASITIKRSPLWPYTSAQSLSIWRCPADLSTVTAYGATLPRVRSYSMNNWINGTPWFNSGNAWRVFTKLQEFNTLNPVNAFLLMDEHPSGINDNMLLVDMSGYPNNGSAHYLVDLPTSAHAGGAGVAFVDGHVELKRWTDTRTVAPHVNRNILLNVPSPHNPDVLWLQERTTRLKTASF